MIAVLFEAWPVEGCLHEYLDLASSLRARLDDIDGFISVERFESLQDRGKILSLSFWRDEEAIRRWRTLEEHRTVQARGRGAIFRDYRLRIAAVVRDYGMTERAEAPDDSRAFHPGHGLPGDTPQGMLPWLG